MNPLDLPPVKLTPRQLQHLDLASMNVKPAAIGKRLGVSTQSAKITLHVIAKKFGLTKYSWFELMFILMFVRVIDDPFIGAFDYENNQNTLPKGGRHQIQVLKSGIRRRDEDGLSIPGWEVRRAQAALTRHRAGGAELYLWLQGGIDEAQ